MEIVKKAVEIIFKWVGIIGAIAILVLSVAIWSFYDISEQHSRLSVQETVGLILFSLLVVSFFKLIFVFVIKRIRKGAADE